MSKPPMPAQVWQPPKAPQRARQRVGPVPVRLTVFDTPGRGPEDVAVDAGGNVYTGIADGRILRFSPDATHIDTVADTHGRPLGIEIDADGDLLVCDAKRGLLHVEVPTGRVTVVADTIDGAPMVFCNNGAIAADGTVYFSDSSTRFGIDHWRGELLAHTGTGRMLRRTPDGAQDVLLDGLEFANGVALAPDESCVVIAETSGYSLVRLWLTGPREGRRDYLVENLPGFPDNISTGSDGLIWVTLPSPRDPTLDFLLPRAPVLRKIAWSMPERLQPQEKKTVWVQAYDLDGTLVHDLQTTHEWFHLVTGVREVSGTVWLGSLTSPGIARIEL
ncbi:MAG TPA: SMP-30/gluconolactonase/LRE family protein [Jatrophihabitantaceae bacterium]